ncbi:MAG: polymer-forming cytoskeletal protein [bacterium]
MEKSTVGITNIIGEGTEINGKVFVPGSVRIDGRVDGEMSITEMMTVGRSGNLKGTITTKDAVVGGRIEGTLNVKNRIELQKTAKVSVDMNCKFLVIEEGVVFDGTCSMTKQSDKQEPVKH